MTTHSHNCNVYVAQGSYTCQPIPQPWFFPRELVRISLLSLNYRGRVQSVTWDGFEWRISVEYADDRGDLQTRQFYQDELTKEPLYDPK